MSALADAAFEYAFDGYLIFPLRPGTKVPLTEHGVKDADCDIHVVARWWKRWPQANIGIATGYRADVFDVDDARDLDPAVLSAVLDLEGPTVQTPSGGLHIYGEPGVSSNRARFLPGCDWRGKGGYVVAPPSRDDRGGWEWMEGCGQYAPLPAWPEDILRALAPKPRPAPPRQAPSVSGHKVLAGLMRSVLCANPGQRNSMLNWAAYRAREHVAAGTLDARTVAVDLIAAGMHLGLPEREVVATVRSGLGEMA